MFEVSAEWASSLPVNQRAAALVKVVEDQWFDRKSARVAPRDLAEALVAFANAEGGLIVVGLHGGQVEELQSARESALRQAAMDYTSPTVRVKAERLEILGSRGESSHLLLLDVQPSDVVHETSKGECFLRVGDESRKLTYTQRQELHYDRGAAQFEGTPAKDVELNQLDVRQIQSLKDAVGFGPDAPLATILNARSLLTVRGEVTIAALLLLGAFPQSLLPQAHVRVLRYREAYRGTGRHQTLDAEGDRRLEGCIPDVIRAAVHVMDDWVPKRRALGSRGLFEDTPVIPRDAWLEGLVNAVVHRSYSLAGDHVRVEIFPDRIEIESPGRFPGLADPRRPLEISRYARNPRIARVCSDLRITQERGEGIRRIFDEMRGVGLVDPTYEQTSGSVRLTLMSADRLDAAVARRLPMGASDVLAALREADRPLGTGELMEVLGRSRPWVREKLEALRAEGQVQWRGKSPRDPHAAWGIAGPETAQTT